MTKLVIVAGPTASGKSEFAIKLAKQLNGEIISCDSMQIYKSLNIGTAKIQTAETQGIPHYMIDIIEPKSEFSVQEFKERAEQKINEISSRSHTPILVGGTGLYIKAILHPYSFANSPKDEEVRNYYKNILAEKGKEYLYNLLKEKDSASCEKIHINDTKKVIRALEIITLSGKKKSDTQNENKKAYDYLMCVLSPKREELYAKINNRVDKMFDLGLEKEIKNLLDLGMVQKDSQSMQAIGYKELFDYFDGIKTLDETKELIKQHTRNYAKRQVTFFKSFEDAIWLENEEDKEKFLNNCNILAH